jgi:hypothetical protein
MRYHLLCFLKEWIKLNCHYTKELNKSNKTKKILRLKLKPHNNKITKHY